MAYSGSCKAEGPRLPAPVPFLQFVQWLDRTTILRGDRRPLRITEGALRLTISQVVAAKVRDVARRDGQGLTRGTRDFIEAHSEPADQQVLPLWQ